MPAAQMFAWDDPGIVSAENIASNWRRQLGARQTAQCANGPFAIGVHDPARIPSPSVAQSEPLSEASRLSWFFTEIMEIGILGNMGRPTDDDADQGDWFISADEAREWQRQQDENEARIRR